MGPPSHVRKGRGRRGSPDAYSSPLAQRIAQDLQDGIQIPLSAGYKVHATRDDRSTVPVTRIATDWEPLEVSLVPIAAEETGTGFRTAA
jgi:hypothetical protein